MILILAMNSVRYSDHIKLLRIAVILCSRHVCY